MTSKTADLTTKVLRLNKSYIDGRGNLYLAKIYQPNELPISVIEKADVSIVPNSESEILPLDLSFKNVTSDIPEQKIDVQVRSLNSKKKSSPKSPEIIDVNPIEAVDPIQ